MQKLFSHPFMLIIYFLFFSIFSTSSEDIYSNDVITVYLKIKFRQINKDENTIIMLPIDLYNNKYKKTVKNFRELLLKEKGYKKSYFFKLIKDYYIMGGDYVFNSGYGGLSIYKEPFTETIGDNKHKRGSLSMVCTKDKKINSQFYLSFNEIKDFDGEYVVFGQVREEFLEDLIKMNDILTKNDKPVHEVQIIDCGDYSQENVDTVIDKHEL